MPEIEMVLKISAARAFVAHKGRLPTNSNELADWLMEFAALESGRADAFQRVFEEHMSQCNRPRFVRLDKQGIPIIE